MPQFRTYLREVVGVETIFVTHKGQAERRANGYRTSGIVHQASHEKKHKTKNVIEPPVDELAAGHGKVRECGLVIVALVGLDR